MSNPLMRAKFRVLSVENLSEPDRPCEVVTFAAVCEKPFDSKGNSEDNTFALFTPDASLRMTINNPALVGKIVPEQKFYVDFTPADAPSQEEKPASPDEVTAEGEPVETPAPCFPPGWFDKPTFGK